MGEGRWTVTYTKHLHQKRKVYQDGILELDGPRNKVFLYDEAEKPLDSRYLKKDEVITCGGTLAFNSYIVDIGDCEEKPKHASTMRVNDGEEKSNAKLGMKWKNSMHSSAGIKRAIHNNGDAQDRQDATKNHCKEWNVLYTTQITQKSKKYHDGILQLTDSRSHAKQVILLNEDRSVLSSSYLRAVDFLNTGVTYELPGYLVQIGDPRNLQGDLNTYGPVKSNLSNGIAVANSEDPGKNKLSEGIAVTKAGVWRTPLKRKYDGKKTLCNEEMKKNVAVESKGTGISHSTRIPCTMGAPKNQSCRNVLQIISHLQNAGESCRPKMSKERCEASNPFIPDLLDGINIGGILTPNINSKTFGKQGHEMDPQGSNDVANIHVSSMNDAAMNTSSSEHRLNSDLLDSVNFSTGILPSVSMLDVRSSEFADSIQETLIVESGILDHNNASKSNQDKHANQPTTSAVLTCILSCGRSAAISENNTDTASFSEIEREKLYCRSNDSKDNRATCGSMEVLHPAKDEFSNQLAGVNTNCLENIGSCSQPLTVQSSLSLAPAGVPSEASESSGTPKIQRTLHDTPSFDLGF